MKGQFVFEFLIAGLIFFAIVVYTINYLNVNVSDFKGKFYQNRLQSKAIQISEVLVKGSSPLSLAEDSEFDLSRIQGFNSTYCTPGGYDSLIEDLYLYENTAYGRFSDNVKILLSSPSETLLDCGSIIPRNITKAEVGRYGTLGGEMLNLRVVVW
jgi:hypothetical protein